VQLGLYIHIPFCTSKCPYCDFNSIADGDEELRTRYIEALCAELRLGGKLAQVQGRTISTIYIGGGTPTIYEAEELARLLQACRRWLDVDSEAEITIEANPGTISHDKLRSLREVGFNRLSIGVQSFQRTVLQQLGRSHTAAQAVSAVEEAHAVGFPNINIDLIHSVPGESPDEWTCDLEQVVRLEPHHISAYSLTVEPNSEFGRMVSEGSLLPVDEDTDAAMFVQTHSFLTRHGYRHYEVSNYALAGYECRHNLIYWNNEEWLGVGAGAHSHLSGERRWNTNSPAEYIRRINTEGNAITGRERGDLRQQMGETMMLGLRKAEGVSVTDFRQRFGQFPEQVFAPQVRKLRSAGLLKVGKKRLALTAKGMRLANMAMMEFIG